MAVVLIFLAFVPLSLGYFIATLFAPLLLMGALLGLLLWVACFLPLKLALRLLSRSRSGRDLRGYLERPADLLIDFGVYFPQFVKPTVRGSSEPRILGRRLIGEMLVLAQAGMVGPAHLRVTRCFDRADFHGSSEGCVTRQVFGHDTGGAIDVTLIGLDGQTMSMGNFGFASEEEPTSSDQIASLLLPDLIRSNRSVLASALSGAGFVNSPNEWWHWSYGDQPWVDSSKESTGVQFESIHG